MIIYYKLTCHAKNPTTNFQWSWIFDIAPYQTLSHLEVIFLIDSLSKDLFFWRSSFFFGFPKEEWTWLDWLKQRFRFYTVLDKKVGWWTLTPICRWQSSLFRSPYPPPFPMYGVESQSIHVQISAKTPMHLWNPVWCDSSQATFQTSFESSIKISRLSKEITSNRTVIPQPWF